MDGIIKKIMYVGPGETYIRIQIELDVEFDSELMNANIQIDENNSVTITRISIMGEVTSSQHNKINWEVSNSDVIPKLKLITGKIIEFKPPNKVYLDAGMDVEIYNRELVSSLKSQGLKIGDWVTARCLTPPNMQIMKKKLENK